MEDPSPTTPSASADSLADLREQVRLVAEVAARLTAEADARADRDRTRDALLDKLDAARPGFLLQLLRPFVQRLAQLADGVVEWERNPPADRTEAARCLAAIGRQLREMFAVHGVQEVRPTHGDVFDPRWHFAADTQPTADPAAHDRIAELRQHGYLFFGQHDRTAAVLPALIRPARVVTWKYDPNLPPRDTTWKYDPNLPAGG